MWSKILLLAVATFCATPVVQAQEFNDRPLGRERRAGFIRGHAECVQSYTKRFETSSASPADVADAALESCANWMDDLKAALPSFEDRDTTVAKIQTRARRASIKQTLEARLTNKK